jgi:hypothetical protein
MRSFCKALTRSVLGLCVVITTLSGCASVGPVWRLAQAGLAEPDDCGVNLGLLSAVDAHDGTGPGDIGGGPVGGSPPNSAGVGGK